MVESLLVVGVFVEDVKVEFWVGLERDDEDVDDLFGLFDDERREDVDDDDVDVGRGWDSSIIFDVDVLPLTISDEDEDGVLLIEFVRFDFEDFIIGESREREKNTFYLIMIVYIKNKSFTFRFIGFWFLWLFAKCIHK